MTMFAQGSIVLVSLMMFFLGTKSMFAPKSMLENFDISPGGAAGLNTIRGVIGGLFIASLGMLITGLVLGETLLFLAVAAIMMAVAFGRLIGLISDGFNKAVVPPLIVELVISSILIFAHLKLSIS